MTHSKDHIIPHGVSLIVLCAVLLVILLAAISPRPAQAFPEYAQRTHEPCATCHVSPGGGGPRTMRGLLWIAGGRPDQVRAFEGILLAPGVNDPQVLYDRACTACHGTKGEGGSAAALSNFDFSESLVRRKISQGATNFGMPDFQGQFTDEQIEALAQYVSDLSAGRLVPPESYPLPPGELSCSSSDDKPGCGPN